MKWAIYFAQAGFRAIWLMAFALALIYLCANAGEMRAWFERLVEAIGCA